MKPKNFIILLVVVIVATAGAYLVIEKPSCMFGNELEKIDFIRIDNPRPNQIVESPLLVKGEARGYWFFEADFPVKLFDADGNLLALAVAQAESEWMTEDFVPFEAILEFQNPGSGKGTLVLEKDNPSGLPEHYDELIIPIYFKVTD